MESNINTKDINKLLKLYRQLLKSIISETPEKNKELWEKCLEQAKKEHIDELKEHESQLSPPRNTPPKVSQEEDGEFEKAFKHITTKNADTIYRKRDSRYNDALLKKEKKIKELIKKIDHFQYAVKNQLIEFDRAHSTLLATDWQKIREIFPVIDITHPNFQFHVVRSIDAIEAIKCKVKQQQPNSIQKVKNCLWMLYEKTIKAIWEGTLNKNYPT